MLKKIGLWLLGVGVIMASGTIYIYNNLLTLESFVQCSLSNLESVLQRRLDLIPNLVNTIKGYTLYESKTLQGVIEARAKALAIKINLESEESVKQFQKAHSELGKGLSRLLAISERYPILKASDLFKDLMVQIEGAENRINIGRQELNASIQKYNISIRKFPHSLINKTLLG